MNNKPLTDKDIQLLWDQCLYVGWTDFLTLERCHEIFINALSINYNIKGIGLYGIGRKHNLKRYFAKNKGSDDLFIPYQKQQARAVLCERIKPFRNLMSIPMEELTMEGFLYYLRKNKWMRYTSHYDPEMTKQRNKTNAHEADRYISLRGLTSTGNESAR